MMIVNLRILRHVTIRSWSEMILFMIVIAVSVGCGPSDTQQEAISPITNEAYPIQTDNNLTQNNNTDSYPAPTTPTGTLLALNKPIMSSDTEVSGVGPPGLPINIVNITLMGEQLGAAVIEDDGTFVVPISLQPNIRIGISADIEAFGLTTGDVQPGDGAVNVPLVGYFFDSTIVSQN